MDLENRNDNSSENPELEDNLIELIDEDGQSSTYELLDSFIMDGNEYIAVADPEDESEDLEVYILKVDQDENGEDIYTVPDDEESDKAFDYFMEHFEDEAPADDEE